MPAVSTCCCPSAQQRRITRAPQSPSSQHTCLITAAAAAPSSRMPSACRKRRTSLPLRTLHSQPGREWMEGGRGGWRRGSISRRRREVRGVENWIRRQGWRRRAPTKWVRDLPAVHFERPPSLGRERCVHRVAPPSHSCPAALQKNHHLADLPAAAVLQACQRR